MITPKDFLLQKCEDNRKEWKGTKNLTVIDWMELMDEYAQYYYDSKIEKKSIKKRGSNFTTLVLQTNYLEKILSQLEVLNTNGTSFIEYWTEHGENDRKMRFEKQASFDIKRRLLTWKNNNYNKNNNAKPTYTDKVGEYLNR